MKLNTNLCFVLIFFVVISNSSIAQRYYELSFEVVGGINYTYYSEASPNIGRSLPYEEKMGFNIGGGFTYRATELLALHIEVIYSEKQFQQGNDQSYIKQKLLYIDIPLLLQLNISPNVNVKTLFYFGSYVSFLIKQDQESSQIIGISYFHPNKYDYGLLLGGGIGIPIDNFEVGIDIRYHFGLGNLNEFSGYFDQPNNYYASTYDGRLNSLVLLLKFGFNFLQNDD